MSISFPRTDILTPFLFASQSLRLVARQEYSRLASGVTIGKDLGSALWLADYTTVALPNDDALTLEAKLNSLDGVINAFEAGDIRRPYPKSHPDGVFGDTGALQSVNANSKAIRISGLDAGTVLSVGDYLSFTYGGSRALHQVVEAVTADAAGLTAEFEVRPHVRSGWSAGAAITLKQPKGLFTLLPDSVATATVGPMDSTVSFKAVQFL
ncbi:hypothetical protein ACMA5K_24140 [Bradyrhizobium diazoefficiens]|uniref:hypothetical protein n=1 Tax=Bradyrhizobium diazoefficiens TaxID=1355477 RepID=UPI000BE8D8AF|nr:hypothetical protein [Bradyrhizobium diazoefficiens]PDT58723.1 hypothetical protein CO678_26185 [Bradyrhizobium diazoefficiens]QLD43835.1 hypothetical protein HUW42_23920 [Bradyrhizobium diazoefficiens]